MAFKLGLTRDQLASFLKDPEQIKQFEKLFTTVDQTVTVILPAIDTDAGIAEAQANESISAIVANHQQTQQQIGTLQAGIDTCAAQLTELVAEVQGLEARYDDSLSGRIERLSDEIDGLAALAIVHEPPKRRRLGNFYDTTTQTAAAINTAYAITFDTTDISDGVYLGSPTSRVIVDTEATYNFQFSAQFDNTSGGNHLVYVWYRINGADVANSASQIRLKGTDGELVAAWNFVIKLKAGDYFELVWSVTDIAVQLVAQAAAAPVPAIPSVILSVVTAD